MEARVEAMRLKDRVHSPFPWTTSIALGTLAGLFGDGERALIGLLLGLVLWAIWGRP